MKNPNSSDGIAEDLIRSFVQISAAELHAKTILEKRISELEEGLIDIENPAVLSDQLDKIEAAKNDLIDLAECRREDMRYLYTLFGERGDKEQWCTAKHLAMAMITAFEVWQASDSDEALLNMALRKNKLFTKAISRFIGVEITDCASCLSDMLKGVEK